MRFFASLAMLSLATLSLAAQRERLRPGDDQPVTIRGCLHGRILRANEPEHQTPSSRNWVTKGQRFALSGDLDLMAELEDYVRHEVDITGWLEVPDRARPVAPLPRGPRGLPPGLPPNPFDRPPAAAPRITLSLDGGKMEELVVTAYQHVGLNCLQ